MTPDFRSDRAEHTQKTDQAESRVFIDMADPKNSLTASVLGGAGRIDGSKNEPAILNFDDPYTSNAGKSHDGMNIGQFNRAEFDLGRFISSFNLTEKERWMFQALDLNLDPSQSYAAEAYQNLKAKNRDDAPTTGETYAAEAQQHGGPLSRNARRPVASTKLPS